MKYYIIAGEASGDLHASNLVKEIKKRDAAAEFRAWGGDLLEAEGAHLVKHYRELAFMGFIEVIANLRTILRNIDLCKNDILNYAPDCLILVDYPGFNLRIASFASEQNIKVAYYISPQVWAWKQSRVKQIREHVGLMMVILPFEKDFYAKFSYPVEFVGHPLLDAIGNIQNESKAEKEKVIALLPGSRKQEISSMLPVMLSVVNDFPGYQFVVGGAPSVEPAFYNSIIKEKQVEVVHGATYELLQRSEAALVTSGTATLETALFGVPEVVCYKGNMFSYYIARQLIKVKYISLVNLIMDREVVKELIQDELNKSNLKKELHAILEEGPRKRKLKSDYAELKKVLGGPGASARAAELVEDFISGKS